MINVNMYEVNETYNMIEHEKLDVRTITLGISLLDCVDSNLEALNERFIRKSRLWQRTWFPRARISRLISVFPLSTSVSPSPPLRWWAVLPASARRISSP